MVTVRPAIPDDAHDIVRINVAGWRRAYTGIVPAEVLAAMDIDARVPRYRQRMGEPGSFETLVATAADGGPVLGYVSCGPYRIGQSARCLDSRVGEVVAIYVDPAAWGAGTGRVLMDAALHRLVERDFDEVRLWVLEANEGARRFYARTGFAPDGARAGYPVSRPDGSVVELAEIRYARHLG
jgi:ribosomal protein S18 acetylase RimI-like enzyme